MSTTKQYGVTPPVSLNGPRPEIVAITKTLHEELARRKQFESDSEARHRENVLGRLQLLVEEFVKRACLKNGLSAAAADDAGGKIFTFGSYRLGVHGPGADIDTLCVVPKYVSREDFFTMFEGMLREREEVTELSSVPDAYVPIIKMKFSAVEIDLLFARLALPSIPADLDLRDDAVLRNLDERCIRSMNGSRVTDEILSLVPDVAVFREALRTIKLWAKRRAIYSNVNGFLGGVAWAMLVARVCQLFPNEIAGGIVTRFFVIVLQWPWPQPVTLKRIEDGPLQIRVWNPKLYPADKAHRMPIITPAYPSMCSTHNVTFSTQEVMKAELKRAAGIVDKIPLGHATWSELFEQHDFFTKYRIYLQITASSTSQETQLKWSGTVESKVRQLVMKLEVVEGLLIAHPFTKGLDRVFYCLNDQEGRSVTTGGVISPELGARTEADIEGKPDGLRVFTTNFFIGMQVDIKPKGTGARRLDLTYPTSDFIKLVKAWEPFNGQSMGITVRHIKSTGLPDYVFEGLEKPPPAARAPKRPNSQAPAENGAEPVSLQKGSGAGQPFKKARTVASAFVAELALPTGAPAAPATPATEAATALQNLNTASATPTPSPAHAASAPSAAQAVQS